MTTTPHTNAEALRLADLIDHARQGGNKTAAALIRSQVQEIEQIKAAWEQERNVSDMQAQEIERLRNRIHTCGPTCSKAGCVNGRLRDALSALVDPAGYTVGYPSSSVQAKAARAALKGEA